MQQQTAPRPSWTALGVVQHRDSLGDGRDIRRSEGAGAVTVPVLLISVGSRRLGAFGPDEGQTAFDSVAAPRPLLCFRVRDPDKLDCAITIRCLPRQSHVLVSTVQPDPMLVWWFVRNSRHPEGLRPG